MKILKAEKLCRFAIEYPVEERGELFDKLDKQFGYLGWRSTRSGPSGKADGKGLAIIEVVEEEVDGDQLEKYTQERNRS